ncbi:uncharacterized protein LOC111615772 [Centruroides sculpturatus]|uniref:uncharacterized protein LOC111615772 n=1 Tax=Centruroides sculpturatus TaxID=218467 RepID=UPI000C6CF140|nr:uncharacterized protein LOC111615772 [Centruroides sculpturatus]
MDILSCDKEIEDNNPNEEVAGDQKEVAMQDSVETIVHIIMDLAARKRREEAKSSSSDFVEKLNIDQEESFELNEKGEVMEEVSKTINEFDEAKTGDDRYSWESESMQDDGDDRKTTKCSNIFCYLFMKLPSVIFSCWKRKK